MRPIREIHEDCLNEALASIDDEDDRLQFLQDLPTFRQCERSEYQCRKIIPPNLQAARDIAADGIFTLDPETGINTVVFDDHDYDKV